MKIDHYDDGGRVIRMSDGRRLECLPEGEYYYGVPGLMQPLAVFTAEHRAKILREFGEEVGK